MWDSLCLAMDRPSLAVDPRFESDELRVENSDALYAEIAAWTQQRNKWDVMKILGEAGVPCSAVFDTVDLFASDHLNDRDFVHTIDHPEHGEIKLLGWAPRMSKSQVPLQRAPLMGEHSDEILAADLDLGVAQLAELRQSGIVG
jgi:formyl-CoA transferase